MLTGHHLELRSFKEIIILFFSVLPNSFRNEESDICLIVKDLEKGWKVDHEPTIHHYKELLESKNVSCIKEVMLSLYLNLVCISNCNTLFIGYATKTTEG